MSNEHATREDASVLWEVLAAPLTFRRAILPLSTVDSPRMAKPHPRVAEVVVVLLTTSEAVARLPIRRARLDSSRCRAPARTQAPAEVPPDAQARRLRSRFLRRNIPSHLQHSGSSPIETLPSP
jgi:hypothetical protein